MSGEKKCTVLVTSCDAYEDIEKGFLTLFRRYWGDCPFEVVLLTETKGEEGFDRVIRTGRGKSWSAMLVEALEEINSDYVLMLMNDYFLSEKVDTGLINRRIEEMQEADALSYRLVPEPPTAIKNTAYSISCKATIWNREFLKELASKTGSAWDFERRGSFMFDEEDKRPIMVAKEREFPFIDIVHKGYWEPNEIAFLEREQIPYDFKVRGLPPLKVKISEMIKGKIFWWCPNLVTRLQNWLGR